ncbi:multidrug DMT transporter permease [candidate division KSB1 bacterium]|nr:multidrug DMT transporter permease [candidate division KSB1 bacterium]
MVVITSYAVAVFMCFITMLCWGSWANTQKLSSKEWRFQLFYWDYAIGVLLLALVLATTMGSLGSLGRGFLTDLGQATITALGTAFLGGIIFNLANILLVAAIDIAGMAVAFPVGIGIALVQGVLLNYFKNTKGNPVLLFTGVALIVVAIVIDAMAYRKIPGEGQKNTAKGLIISVIAGISMGFFYRFVADSMAPDFAAPAPGLLTPYTAVVIFSLGLLLSNFIFVTIIMKKPFVGDPVPLKDYFSKGTPRLHMIGILGGAIWSLGMSFNIIASGVTSPAISYGLGQGATMVAAFWGVFIWKEFKNAPSGTSRMLAVMFISFIIGLGLIIFSGAN